MSNRTDTVLGEASQWKGPRKAKFEEKMRHKRAYSKTQGTGSWVMGQPEARDASAHLLGDVGCGYSCFLNQPNSVALTPTAGKDGLPCSPGKMSQH